MSHDPNDPNNRYGWGQQPGQGQPWQQPGQPAQQAQPWEQQQQAQQQQAWQQQQAAQQQQAWQQQQAAQQQAWHQQQQAAQQQAWQQQQQAAQQQAWQQQAAQQQAAQQQPWQAQQQQPWQQQQAHAQQPWQQQQQQQAQQPWQQQPFQAGSSALGGAVASDASGRSIEGAVATVGVNERVTFIRKTYMHLLGAILVFTGLEFVFLGPLKANVSDRITIWALAGGQYNWLIFLGLFMGVSWIADKWAHSAVSRGMQYAGLGLYVLAEAIIFIPLLTVASNASMGFGGGDKVIPAAAIATLVIFGGLTAAVFISRKDFSFLRGALCTASAAGLGLILAACLWGFQLGMIFSFAMVFLAGGYILYYTSKVLAHYHTQQYVAAALALFSAIALLFWYVIRILMSLRR